MSQPYHLRTNINRAGGSRRVGPKELYEIAEEESWQHGGKHNATLLCTPIVSVVTVQKSRNQCELSIGIAMGPMILMLAFPPLCRK